MIDKCNKIVLDALIVCLISETLVPRTVHFKLQTRILSFHELHGLDLERPWHFRIMTYLKSR